MMDPVTEIDCHLPYGLYFPDTQTIVLPDKPEEVVNGIVNGGLPFHVSIDESGSSVAYFPQEGAGSPCACVAQRELPEGVWQELQDAFRAGARAMVSSVGGSGGIPWQLGREDTGYGSVGACRTPADQLLHDIFAEVPRQDDERVSDADADHASVGS